MQHPKLALEFDLRIDKLIEVILQIWIRVCFLSDKFVFFVHLIEQGVDAIEGFHVVSSFILSLVNLILGPHFRILILSNTMLHLFECLLCFVESAMKSA